MEIVLNQEDIETAVRWYIHEHVNPIQVQSDMTWRFPAEIPESIEIAVSLEEYVKEPEADRVSTPSRGIQRFVMGYPVDSPT